MDEQRHLATVELVEDWSEGRIAERLAGVTREQPDAVELQGVEGVGDFAHAALDVRQRNGSKHPETAGEIPRHLRAEFIAVASPTAPLLAVVPLDAGTGHRRDGRANAGLVHLLEDETRRPIGEGASRTPTA